MPQKKDEVPARAAPLHPVVAVIVVVVLAVVGFYVYAVPAIEAGWAVWGIWVEVGLVIVAIGGVGLLWWWHKIGVQEEKEMKEKKARAEEEKRRFEAGQTAKGLVRFTKQNGDELWGTPSQVEQWKRTEEE